MVAFQALLLPDSELTVAADVAIDLTKAGYEPSWYYDGGHRFQKHYFAPAPGELKNSGDEFDCAVFLDGLSEVKAWIRNLSRKGPFWMRRSTQNFYPDFVCLLNDGRVLAVEFKGEHLVTADEAKEKAAVGAVWESRSQGHCLFVMPTKGKLREIRDKILGSVSR